VTSPWFMLLSILSVDFFVEAGVVSIFVIMAGCRVWVLIGVNE